MNALSYDIFSCTVDINDVVLRHVETVVLLDRETVDGDVGIDSDTGKRKERRESQPVPG